MEKVYLVQQPPAYFHVSHVHSAAVCGPVVQRPADTATGTDTNTDMDTDTDTDPLSLTPHGVLPRSDDHLFYIGILCISLL